MCEVEWALVSGRGRTDRGRRRAATEKVYEPDHRVDEGLGRKPAQLEYMKYLLRVQ